MRTEFLCISVLRITSGHRVKLASCKSALHPDPPPPPPPLPSRWFTLFFYLFIFFSFFFYSTDRSKVVVPVLVLLFVALWFILRGDLFYVLLGVICLFVCLC